MTLIIKRLKNHLHSTEDTRQIGLRGYWTSSTQNTRYPPPHVPSRRAKPLDPIGLGACSTKNPGSSAVPPTHCGQASRHEGLRKIVPMFSGIVLRASRGPSWHVRCGDLYAGKHGREQCDRERRAGSRRRNVRRPSNG